MSQQTPKGSSTSTPPRTHADAPQPETFFVHLHVSPSTAGIRLTGTESVAELADRSRAAAAAYAAGPPDRRLHDARALINALAIYTFVAQQAAAWECPVHGPVEPDDAGQEEVR